MEIENGVISRAISDRVSGAAVADHATRTDRMPVYSEEKEAFQAMPRDTVQLEVQIDNAKRRLDRLRANDRGIVDRYRQEREKVRDSLCLLCVRDPRMAHALRRLIGGCGGVRHAVAIFAFAYAIITA